ncbi:hypothetical protein PtA15_7A546 [Puccinia triticina]|uniref:Nucleolar 27S pre-rRNA processing Urb2/Npa2 C-terminal domain-containing protein n=1 Tax=Puccinia triticina TaxID=208348 RepID=A0ABY7CVS2_9BASI|nr:uncharacterized protein PtA15_7A546 [Puccinia triticina]WAQ86817.1 hypothetical protein PtA15_7A546 [Puccinia triticina]
MSGDPSILELSNRPADLFQSLRSRDTPIEQRLKLAQLHWTDPKFTLPYKQLYFLRWIFEVDFFEPKRSNKKANTESFTSPVHYPVFWSLLRQLVSDIQAPDLSTVLGGTPPIILLRHTLLEWSNLLEDLQFSQDVWSNLNVIFPIISQRLSLDVSLEILNEIFEGLMKLGRSISEPVEQIVLLIIKRILPTIEHATNSRKAFNSIILNQKKLNSIIQVAFSPYSTSSLKALVFRIIQSLIFTVENLKKVNLNQESPIEWLDALDAVGKKNEKMGAAVIEIVTHLLSALICELPGLRSQLFSQQHPSNGAQSSNSRNVAMDLAYLHATRTFILRVVKNTVEILKDLGSSTSSNLSASIASQKAIVRQILDSNLYDPGQPSQHELLDQIANHCAGHLSNSSGRIAMDSLQILVDLLSLDYTLVEVRLGPILQSLIVSPYDPHDSEPIREFFDGVFNWFSKAKQIPNLFDKWIEIIEAKLSQFSLRDISNGPLMDRTFIERAHEELRLSVSSAQMVVIHDLLTSRLRGVIQSSTLCPSDSNMEPSSKRRRISATQTSSPSKDATTTEASDISDHSANVSALISSFYELFVISASRSSLQSKEWSNLSKKISSFGGEIIGTIVRSTLQCWPSSDSSKNRFRKFKNPSEQKVLASAFRILASVVQVQGPHTYSELDALELSEWLELLDQVSSRKKNHLDPILSFELIHLCLEHTSQRLSCLNTVDFTIPQTAYQTILKLVEDCTTPSDFNWNGSLVSLTSPELAHALWHYLTTTHLSEFATLATPDQINQFAQIAIKFISRTLPPQPSDGLNESGRFSIISTSRMMLRSPVFLECTSLREPLLQKLVAAFEAVMPLDEGTSFSELDVNQLDSVNCLYDVISYLPLSYFTKWARKRLFKWSFAWNEALLSPQVNSESPHSQTVSVLRSRVFLCKILADPLSSASPEMMKQAVATIIKILNYCGTEEDENSLMRVTEYLTCGIVTKLMKSMKAGEDSDSSFEQLEKFCLALSQRIKHVAKGIIKARSIRPEDRLIISPLQAIADYGRIQILHSNREVSAEESVLIHRLQQLVCPILRNLEAALKKARAKASSNCSNLGLLELGKIYLQLCRIDGSQSRFRDSLIDLKLLLPSADQLKECQTELEASDSHPQVEAILPECLDLFEEMIQIHRHRYGTKRKDCAKAFQTLVFSHVHLRTSRSGPHGGSDSRSKFRASFIQSCNNANLNESREALGMLLSEINQCSQRFIGFRCSQSSTVGSHSFARFRALIDVAVLLILNYPGHDVNDTLLPHRASSNELEEVILKLLKVLKLVDLDDKQKSSNQQHALNFYSWKTDLIDQLCIQEAHRIGRSSLLEVLETLVELSSRTEFQTVQSLHDKLVSITSHLNQESLRRSLINQFPILVCLLSRLMVPTLDLKNYSRLVADLTSTTRLTAPFSKHSPFLLVDLVSKISQAPASSSVENFVNHGLFSLISTMGKFERNSIGYRILEAQHLTSSDDHYLQADDNANSLLNWKKILKNWETLRYKGTD